MKLIGNYLSPYVRRVAISLNALDMRFKLEELFVFKAQDTVRSHNPVVRIPVLILNDGETLVESSAILDAIDQLAGPRWALVPPGGPERRAVMQIVALANACAEKAQWAFYEGRVRPEEKVHQPWVDHNDAQVAGGFAHLETLASAAGDNWIAPEQGFCQADITTAVAFSFADKVRPDLHLKTKFPGLASFTARCEDLDAFKAAPIPDPPS